MNALALLIPRPALAAVLLAAALAVLALAARPAAAIFAGDPADPARWSFIVALEKPGGGDFTDQFCAGSLIAPHLVRTAAHWVVGDDGAVRSAAEVEVRPGGRDLSTGATRRIGVARIVVHPLYGDIARGGDAAVLVLDRDAETPTVPLADAGTEAGLAPGTPLLAAGRGDLTDGGRDFPRALHQGTVGLFDAAPCKGALGSLFNAGTDLCAGRWEGGQDTCRGDSGGPLVLRTADGAAVLVGVTSRGRGCGRAQTPGISTRVTAVQDWLAPLVRSEGGPAAATPVDAPAHPWVRLIGTV